MDNNPDDKQEPKLTAKQRLFVAEYLVDLNATQAALRAGYSPKTAFRIGQENMQKPAIQGALAASMKKREEQIEIKANYVLSNLVTLVDRCMQACEVLDKDGAPTGQWKFDAKAAAKGLELLGKHKGLFLDRVQLSTDPTDPLMRAIARAASIQKGLPKPVKE